MKKIIYCFVCVVISLICIVGAACGEQKNEDAVNLVAIDANSVGIMNNIDYYVVPEPAASAKVKAISDLDFAGDLQSLYGGENGYPQAVVVAKNNLLGTGILADFIKDLSTADEWLLSDDNSVKSILDAIQPHLTSGLTSSMTAGNLTKSVISNCGIKFVSATDSKTDIVSFMEKFNAIGNNSFGMPSDEFFFDGTLGTAEYSQQISVYSPDGAPALGLAKLMAENTLQNMEYHVIDPNTVQTLFGENPKADICVLPVNLAVKLLGNAKNYKLIGTLTHGNLYILSKNGTQISADNIDELRGKTVGVINLAQVPGLTFKLILKNYGIEFTEPYND